MTERNPELPALSRPVKLLEWERVDGKRKLLGYAAVEFPSGMRLARVPVFRAQSYGGDLGIGVPSVGRPNPDGSRRFVDIVTFADDATKARYQAAVRCALADAGISDGA